MDFNDCSCYYFARQLFSHRDRHLNLAKPQLSRLVAAMTLEEKAKLVVGMGFKMPSPGACKKRQIPINSKQIRHNRGTFQTCLRLIRQMQPYLKKFPVRQEEHMPLPG